MTEQKIKKEKGQKRKKDRERGNSELKFQITLAAVHTVKHLHAHEDVAKVAGHQRLWIELVFPP